MLNTDPCLNEAVATPAPRLVASLRWLNAHLPRFSPWREGRLADSGIKALAELSIVYVQLLQRENDAGCGGTAFGGLLHAWHDFIWQQCHDPAYAEMTRKRPACAFHLLVPYLMLRSAGQRSPYHEETLRRLQQWGFPQATEVVPYRLMDREYFLWKAGCVGRKPNWYRCYRDTALANIGSLIYSDKEAAYSVTHTLFYLTDFGRRPLPLYITGTERRRVADILESMLLHYWRLGNWDLTGELLLALGYIEETSSFLYADAGAAFCQAFRLEGYAPADRLEVERLRAARGADRDKEIFGACYHTTLVGVLYFMDRRIRSER